MSGGQWVAFDIGSDVPHDHSKTQKKINKTFTKKRIKKKTVLKANEFSDRSGEVYSLQNIPNEWLDLTPMNLSKFFKKIIETERRVLISYRDKNKDETTREIFPLNLIEGYASGKGTSKAMKVVAYCNLRKDYRSFLLSGITEVLADSKVPKSFSNEFASLDQSFKDQILSGNKSHDFNSHRSTSEHENRATYESVKERNDSSMNTNKSDEDSGFSALIFWAIVIYVLFVIFG